MWRIQKTRKYDKAKVSNKFEYLYGLINKNL